MSLSSSGYPNIRIGMFRYKGADIRANNLKYQISGDFVLGSKYPKYRKLSPHRGENKILNIFEKDFKYSQKTSLITIYYFFIGSEILKIPIYDCHKPISGLALNIFGEGLPALLEHKILNNSLMGWILRAVIKLY